MVEPNEAFLRTLFDHVSDVVLVLRRDGRVLLANPAATDVLGFEPDELEGRRFFDLVHSAEVEEARETLDVPCREVEVRCRHRDGRWVPLALMSGRAPLPKSLFPGGGSVLTARDVSEQRLLRESLEASEEKFRAVFEESRDAIVVGTIEGQILDVNPAGVELFGYGSKDEMLEMNIGTDLYWDPAERQKTENEFRERGFVKGLEVDLKTRTGRRIRVEESASAIVDRTGEIIGFRGILRDVTEKRRLEERLRQSQKMGAVGRLANSVAHDFNNLLTTINGYCDLALARMDGDGAERHSVEEIRKAGRRAADLTRRLQALSKNPPTQAGPMEFGGDEHILVVEEETAVRDLLRQVLEQQGYHVLVAERVGEALRLCADLEVQPELLLTNVVMPGRGGIELAFELRKLSPEVRVLYMSAYTETRSEIRQLMDEGADILRKPFTTFDLKRRVRQALDPVPGDA